MFLYAKWFFISQHLNYIYFLKFNLKETWDV